MIIYWALLGLSGAIFTGGAVRLGFEVMRRAAGRDRWALARDLLMPVALVPVALFTVYPYIGNNLVGAGDSYFYGLQLADLVTQLRHGVLPIFVGQSDFAFNGNINSLRTAPYFTHLAGLLDLLTGRQLSFVTLLNLTVTATASFTVMAAYLAALAATGGRLLGAWLLAIAYVASPALIVPLACHDMFATYMTAPWIMLCWYGLAEILRRENDLQPQLIAAGTLALVWYAHAPIAAWLSILWVLAQALRLVLGGASSAQWRRQLLGGLLFAGLAAYVFISISTISTRPPGHVELFSFAFRLEDLRNALRREFIPFVLAPTQAGIQVGWSLWLLLLVAGSVFFALRRLHGLLLLTLLAIPFGCLFPVPHVSEFLWQQIPERLVAQTNWPAQRLCPLLAAGLVVATAQALRAAGEKSPRFYRWICGVLLLGCAWSLGEVWTIHHRPGVARQAPAVHASRFDRDNLVLTRYSYTLFEEAPAYFTHGWADPEFESRLLNENLDTIEDNAGAILAAAGPPKLIPVAPLVTVELAGPAEYLLEFTFDHPTAAGELSIKGAGIERHYELPRSGEALAFGSLPGAAKTIPLRLPSAGVHPITLSTTVPGASFRAVPVERTALPVKLHGLLPYTATVRATRPGFLETPRVYLPGYAATVDGQTAAVRESPNGLVMVPVPEGRSHVTINYPGPLILRAAWLVSLACFAGFPWILLRAGRQCDEAITDSGWSVDWFRQNNLLAGIRRHLFPRWKTALVCATLGGLIAALGFVAHQAWRDHRSYGAIRITFELTRRSLGNSQPILTLGEPGAADCIYITYLDLHHVRFGLDHWSYGGPVSEPIALSYGRPHVIEIDIRGLYPGSRWFNRPDPAPDGKSGIAPFALRLDGRTILQADAPYYAVDPGKIWLGRNPTGGSVTKGSFSGKIIASERFIPSGK